MSTENVTATFQLHLLKRQHVARLINFILENAAKCIVVHNVEKSAMVNLKVKFHAHVA